jgi:hypothetical protein
MRCSEKVRRVVRPPPYPLPLPADLRDHLRTHLPLDPSNDPTTAGNFVSRFHAMLYDEENEQEQALAEYDMEGATLSATPSGKLHRLVVQGLVEGRPSILKGECTAPSTPVREGPQFCGCRRQSATVPGWRYGHSLEGAGRHS